MVMNGIVNTQQCYLFRRFVQRRLCIHQPRYFVTGPTVNASNKVQNEDSKDVQYEVPKNFNVMDISVYGNKKTSEIIRALFVFKLCSYKIVTQNGIKLMHLGQKMLGRRLFNFVMRCTFYGQFVGGQTDKQISQVATSLLAAGLGPLMCVPIEEAPEKLRNSDAIYDANLQKVSDCIDRAASVDRAHPMAQLKLTAIIPVHLCEELSKLVPDPLANDSQAVDAVVRCLEGQPLTIAGLSGRSTEVLAKGLARVRQVCEHTVSKRVLLLIDAEYTYMNPALRLVSLAAMIVYNKDRPLVSYTYQNYLKQTHGQLQDDIDLVRSRGAGFGAKLVRGAYMVQERQRARTEKYPDPVHDTFKDTSHMYSRSVELMLDNIRDEPNKFYVIIATHNQASVVHGIEQIARRGIDKKCGSVFFAQLYGMDDSLSCALGQRQYLVYKSTPIGSVEETLPYLYRRALENSTFLIARPTPDRTLLRAALLDRLTWGLLPRNKTLDR